jgi:hypothetical protein
LEYCKGGSLGAYQGKAITPEQVRIQELEARIKKIEWENDILKKGVTIQHY